MVKNPHEPGEDKPEPPEAPPYTTKQLHQASQGTAFLAEMLPPFWKRLYDNCKKAGFEEPEAFKLLQTYILSQNPNGTRGIS